MTTFNLGPIARGAFHVCATSSAAYVAGRLISDPHCRDIAIIVSIDSVFRIVITHVLDAMHIPYHQVGLRGHLLFSCLTLLTQPLSVQVARLFKINSFHWNNRRSYIALFGYISFGWKATMMVKDVIYLNAPAFKKA